MRLLFLLSTFSIFYPLVVFAQSATIDKSFTVQAHGLPWDLGWKNQRYAFVTYTKFVEIDGKLGICGAYYGLIDRRFIGRGLVFLNNKRVKTNLTKFRMLTNEKRFTEKRKKSKTQNDIYYHVTQVESLDPVLGLKANCIQTKRKIGDGDLNVKPRVKIPEKITVRVY